MKLRNVGYTQCGNHVDYNGAVLIRRDCELEVSEKVAASLLFHFPGAFLPVGDLNVVTESSEPVAEAPPVKRGRGRPRKVC